METSRKRFSNEEKIRLLKLHLIENQTVSDICDKFGISPNLFYQWQKVFFENATAAFEQAGVGTKNSKNKKLEQENIRVKEKLAGKDEVIAEIMGSHLKLKKKLGVTETVYGLNLTCATKLSITSNTGREERGLRLRK